MKNNLKLGFGVILIILIFILGKQCNNSSKNDFKPITDTLIINKTDTIRDTLTVFKMKINTIYRPIEIYKSIDSNKYNNIRQYRVYQDTLRDTNIVIFIKDTILGYLENRQLSYKLLIPLKIYDTTTVIITKQIPKLPKYQLKIGTLISSNYLSPNIDFSINRNTYSLGYDITNKIPTIGYKYTIWYK